MSGKPVEKGKKEVESSAIGRREFLKKGAAAAALLPYVAPVITTFLLDVNEAAAQAARLSPVARAQERVAARAERAVAAAAARAQAAVPAAAARAAARARRPIPVEPVPL